MVEAITHSQIAEMTLAELRQLLNKQIGLKAKMSDELLRTRSGVGQYTTNIHNLRHRISIVAPTKQEVDVCDHAVVRYLERVKGMDIEAIRAEIDSDVLRECVARASTGWHRINGVTYVTEHRTLVTVIVEDGLQPAPVNQPTSTRDSVGKEEA